MGSRIGRWSAQSSAREIAESIEGDCMYMFECVKQVNDVWNVTGAQSNFIILSHTTSRYKAIC